LAGQERSPKLGRVVDQEPEVRASVACSHLCRTKTEEKEKATERKKETERERNGGGLM
jgi:hypothetical protein